MLSADELRSFGLLLSGLDNLNECPGWDKSNLMGDIGSKRAEFSKEIWIYVIKGSKKRTYCSRSQRCKVDSCQISWLENVKKRHLA